MESQHIIADLKKRIKTRLSRCKSHFTPTVCGMIKHDYPELEQLIIKLVAEQGYTISSAIIEVEKMYNANIPD